MGQPMREISRPNLSRLTTLRLGGHAVAEFVLEEKKDLAALFPKVSSLGLPMLVIGKGSNILAMDGELPLVLVRPAFNDKPEIVGQSGEKVFVKVGSGCNLSSLLGFCLRNGLSGLEGLCGIPASVGGAIAMNAGSFGMDTFQSLEQITVATENGFFDFKKNQLKPSYRRLEIPQIGSGWIVTNSIFGLTRRPKDGIFRAMHLNFFDKKSKQPITAYTAGCVFKNPSPQIPAGKLLDMAGFRGKRHGGVAFSARHANFLVNEGHGSAEAAQALIREAQDVVWHKFGYQLDLEVKVVPCHLP